MNYHQVQLVGRATDDAKVIKSEKGKDFASFSVAVNQYRGKDKDAETTFYDCLLFGDKQIKVATDKVKKGDAITVIGRPSIQAYLSKKKEAKASVKVFVSDWQALKE